MPRHAHDAFFAYAAPPAATPFCCFAAADADYAAAAFVTPITPLDGLLPDLPLDDDFRQRHILHARACRCARLSAMLLPYATPRRR